jgi:hypothetical protein
VHAFLESRGAGENDSKRFALQAGYDLMNDREQDEESEEVKAIEGSMKEPARMEPTFKRTLGKLNKLV